MWFVNEKKRLYTRCEQDIDLVQQIKLRSLQFPMYYIVGIFLGVFIRSGSA